MPGSRSSRSLQKPLRESDLLIETGHGCRGGAEIALIAASSSDRPRSVDPKLVEEGFRSLDAHVGTLPGATR